MDPNDPDGSYDMCLSRPDTVRSLCKVQIDPCEAAEPLIMDFVYARLASMRVDACTTEVKECLQSDDRCGKDYTQCVGLDTDSIKALCPVEKLVACQNNGALDNIDQIDSIIQGIYLGIDNALLEECQNAVNEAMVNVCGDTESCSAFDMDDNIGSGSLMSYHTNDGDYVIEGLMSFGKVKITDNDASKTTDTEDTEGVKFGKYEIDINGYTDKLNMADPAAQRIAETLQDIAGKINRKIALLTQDPKINMCVYGRNISQIRQGRETATVARFPHLLDSPSMVIINAGLQRAKENYGTAYEKMLNEALKATSDAEKSALCAAMAQRPGSLSCTSASECNSTNPLATLFDKDDDTGTMQTTAQDGYATKIVINGMSMKEKMTVASNSKGEFVQTDGRGHMIGKVSMSSVYSPDSGTCTITTETTACEDLQNTYRHFSGWVGWWRHYFVKYYNGVACKKFAKPVTTSTTVKL